MEIFRSLLRRLLNFLGLQDASGTTLTVTGILGLAVLLYGLYQLRQPRRGDQGPSSSAAGTSDRPSSSLAAAGRAVAGGSCAAPAWPASAQQQQQQQNQQRQPALSGASPAAVSVARRLHGVRRVTISAPGVLLEEATSEELSEGGATVQASAPALLRDISRTADVYLMCQVADDVGEAAVRGALEHAGLLGSAPGQIAPHRLLFCSTLDGKVSIVRQLEPELHIDGHPQTVQDLQRFVRQLMYIAVPAMAAAAAHVLKPAPNIQQAASLATALGL